MKPTAHVQETRAVQIEEYNDISFLLEDLAGTDTHEDWIKFMRKACALDAKLARERYEKFGHSAIMRVPV